MTDEEQVIPLVPETSKPPQASRPTLPMLAVLAVAAIGVAGLASLAGNANQTGAAAPPATGSRFLGQSCDAGDPVEVEQGADIPTSDAALTADYRFGESLASSVRPAPDLDPIGSGSAAFAFEAPGGGGRDESVLTFAGGSGLSLAPADAITTGKEYSIELLFRFGVLNQWRKVIDFSGGSEDCGLYSFDGRLEFFAGATALGATIAPDSYAHVVLTRDAADQVVGYVNGRRQFSFNDAGELAVIDPVVGLRFFADDRVTDLEYSPGAVARIRVYDGPLSGDEVAALALELSFDAPTEADAIAGVEALARAESEADRFSGAVLVAQDGEVLFSEAAGLADREREIPNTLATRHRIGTLGEMFTAVAILQLVEAGRIELAAPVGDYLTDYPNADVAGRVNIHHLLTHSGGTGAALGAHTEGLRSLQEFIDRYGERGLSFEPGSRRGYSDYGYILLGAIIERVTGQAYDDYLEEHIFAPTNMVATGPLSDDTSRQRGIGYTKPPGALDWRPASDALPYQWTAAGGGYSTVEDLARFGDALLHHDLLSAEFTEFLFAPKSPVGEGVPNGYGFHDLRDGEGYGSVGRGTWGPGTVAELRLFPRSGYVVVVVANVDSESASRIVSHLAGHLPAEG